MNTFHLLYTYSFNVLLQSCVDFHARKVSSCLVCSCLQFSSSHSESEFSVSSTLGRPKYWVSTLRILISLISSSHPVGNWLTIAFADGIENVVKVLCDQHTYDKKSICNLIGSPLAARHI